MNKILKRIVAESEVDEKQQVADGLESLGFELCLCRWHWIVYCKKLGENKTMYVVDDSGISVPSTLDGTYIVEILENEGTDDESESVAEFNGFEDFAANYMDMSKYKDADY